MAKQQMPLMFADGFDEFWAAYPKRKAKKDAQRAWSQIRPTPELRACMLRALAWQCRDPQWLKDGGQYVPHAATWLRGERWTDTPSTTPQISARTARTVEAIYGK